MRDAELIAVCKDFRDGLIGTNSPEGCCAMVSMALQGYLSALHGIDCECVWTDLTDSPNSQYYEHVWLRLPDGRVLDATFDQFCSEELVPVYLGPPTEFHIAPATPDR